MGKVVDEYAKRSRKLIDGKIGLYSAERSEFMHKALGGRKRVLDLGANHGAFTAFFVDDYDVTAVDFDAKNLEVAKERLGVETITYDLNEDISALGEKGKWDGVIMSEVLEHLFFPEKKVSEVAQILKKDGVFVGTVPNGFSLLNRFRYLFNMPEKTSMAEPTHITHFSYTKLRSILEKYFRQVRIVPIGKKEYAFLANFSPNFFAFCLAFECREPIEGDR